VSLFISASNKTSLLYQLQGNMTWGLMQGNMTWGLMQGNMTWGLMFIKHYANASMNKRNMNFFLLDW